MPENGWNCLLPASSTYKTMDLHFLCRCGHHHMITIVAESKELPEYACSKCENELFLTYDTFYDTTKHLYADNFKYATRSSRVDTSSWSTTLSYETPLYDHSLDAFTFKTEKLLTLSLKDDGSYSEKIETDFIQNKPSLVGAIASKLIVHLRKKAIISLTNYVLENRPEPLIWLHKEKSNQFTGVQKSKMLLFFLKNPHLRDVDLFLWDHQCFTYLTEASTVEAIFTQLLHTHKAKSVKKALLGSYKEHMRLKTSCYNPLFDYIMLQVFHDVNYLRYLLSLPTVYKDMMFNELNVTLSKEGLLWLYTLYGEKLLFRVLKEALRTRGAMNLWHDCFRMLNNARNLPLYKEHFEYQRPKVLHIHDELLRVMNHYISSKSLDMSRAFIYQPSELQTQTVCEDLEFRLPVAPKTLHSWGKILHNCIFSYAPKVDTKKTLLFGVFRDQELTYTLEIRDRKIVQAKGLNNQEICHKDFTLIQQWFEDKVINIKVS